MKFLWFFLCYVSLIKSKQMDTDRWDRDWLQLKLDFRLPNKLFFVLESVFFFYSFHWNWVKELHCLLNEWENEIFLSFFYFIFSNLEIGCFSASKYKNGIIECSKKKKRVELNKKKHKYIHIKMKLPVG